MVELLVREHRFGDVRRDVRTVEGAAVPCAGVLVGEPARVGCPMRTVRAGRSMSACVKVSPALTVEPPVSTATGPV